MSGAPRRPCNDCPWRLDAPRGVWPADRFQALFRSAQDDGLAAFACHHSTAERPVDCQGWVRVVGDSSIGVRLAIAKGRVTVAELLDRTGPKLFRSFAAMLRANKVPLPPRNTFDWSASRRARSGQKRDRGDTG